MVGSQIFLSEVAQIWLLHSMKVLYELQILNSQSRLVSEYNDAHLYCKVSLLPLNYKK